VRQGKHNEARKLLERAVAASSQNYLIHYYYAFALSKEATGDMEMVLGLAPESAAIMRKELKRAIELRPDFLESYSLLAFVNLVTDTELEETVRMLERILAGAPRRTDLMFMLAQLYMHKENFKPARELIDKINVNGNAEMRQRAQGLLTQLVSVEEQMARIHKAEEERARYLRRGSMPGDAPEGSVQASVAESFDPTAALRDSLRKPAAGEEQSQGTLTRIDCDARGITFVVKVNDRLFKLHTDTFKHAAIVSFSEDAGKEITCGPRKTQNNVVVAYAPATDLRAKIDGVLKSVEFVPPDFKLKP
jgi:hypothetical protein